jgi:hypothetical protein
MSPVHPIGIEIGITKRFEGRRPENPGDILRREILFEDFVTQLLVNDRTYAFIVDSFPLLHELLGAIHTLQHSSKLSLNMGEGLVVLATRSYVDRDLFEVETVNCDIIVSRSTYHWSVLLLALCVVAANLLRSISSAGVDVYDLVAKFPVQE